MKLWIVTYTHRHGADVWPRFAEVEPDEQDEIDQLENWEDVEGGDYLEIQGPFDLPSAATYGVSCPSCGRNNSEGGNVCTATDCPGVMGELPVTEAEVMGSLNLSSDEWDALPDSVRQALANSVAPDDAALREFIWSLREDLVNFGFDDPDREIDGGDFVGYGCQLYGDVMDLIRGPVPVPVPLAPMQLGEAS